MRTLTAIRLVATAFACLLSGGIARAQPAKGFEAAPVIQKPATDGKVWGALVYGSSAPSSTDAANGDLPKGLNDLPTRLAKVFHFSHFEILGQHTQDVFREYESWVVPSKDLFLKVDSKGRAKGGGINLHLQFWQQQQVLVKTDAVLRERSPIFIGGPKWRDGQLIFVLMLTRMEE